MHRLDHDLIERAVPACPAGYSIEQPQNSQMKTERSTQFTPTTSVPSQDRTQALTRARNPVERPSGRE